MNTVLITGCSSGYGLETARYFHTRGWNVIATMRDLVMDAKAGKTERFAGAPYYAQNRALPWTKSVKRFSAQRNQVFVYVDGDRVEAETVSVTGETIDRFSLSDPR